VSPTCVALVPARAGSKRVPSKNVRELDGHPLIAYTLAAAAESGVFAAVVVSTDAESVAAIARRYGGEAPFLRPADLAGDMSPDIAWVGHALATLASQGRSFDAFSILRPTSPFRQAATIRRAWERFLAAKGADSIRAVEPCRQHPGKMWIVEGDGMHPYVQGRAGAAPWHSTPYQALPKVHAQNASLEIAWTRVVTEKRSIAGDVIAPFETQGLEGFDINGPDDWILAEHHARTPGALPAVKR